MRRTSLISAAALSISLALAGTASAADREAGLALAKKSGCLACHSIDAKIVGPPWMKVSQRYQGDDSVKERLVNKVKTGGKGNWTEVTGGVAMPAYSPRVADEDIERLVEFVLSLAGEE